ncbi:hypothetical protein [Actinomadura sp. 9N215]|uniref:hypothetical protein n=1 Tax=Actinomadura sp. 9N215 TaxID=3375150 RepID=UPI0037A1ABC9
MLKIGHRKPALAALAGAAILATAAAGTAATWTFLPGGKITAHNDLNLIVENIDNGAVVTCDTSAATSTAKSGTGLSGDDLVTIDAISFSHSDNGVGGDCNGPGGLLVRVTALALPWKFQAQSYDVTGGTVKGKVTGVVAKGEGSDGCELELGGPNGGRSLVSEFDRPSHARRRAGDQSGHHRYERLVRPAAGRGRKSDRPHRRICPGRRSAHRDEPVTDPLRTGINCQAMTMRPRSKTQCMTII